ISVLKDPTFKPILTKWNISLNEAKFKALGSLTKQPGTGVHDIQTQQKPRYAEVKRDKTFKLSLKNGAYLLFLEGTLINIDTVQPKPNSKGYLNGDPAKVMYLTEKGNILTEEQFEQLKNLEIVPEGEIEKEEPMPDEEPGGGPRIQDPESTQTSQQSEYGKVGDIPFKVGLKDGLYVLFSKGIFINRLTGQPKPGSKGDLYDKSGKQIGTIIVKPEGLEAQYNKIAQIGAGDVWSGITKFEGLTVDVTEEGGIAPGQTGRATITKGEIKLGLGRYILREGDEILITRNLVGSVKGISAVNLNHADYEFGLRADKIGTARGIGFALRTPRFTPLFVLQPYTKPLKEYYVLLSYTREYKNVVNDLLKTEARGIHREDISQIIARPSEDGDIAYSIFDSKGEFVALGSLEKEWIVRAKTDSDLTERYVYRIKARDYKSTGKFKTIKDGASITFIPLDLYKAASDEKGNLIQGKDGYYIIQRGKYKIQLTKGVLILEKGARVKANGELLLLQKATLVIGGEKYSVITVSMLNKKGEKIEGFMLEEVYNRIHKENGNPELSKDGYYTLAQDYKIKLTDGGSITIAAGQKIDAFGTPKIGTKGLLDDGTEVTVAEGDGPGRVTFKFAAQKMIAKLTEGNSIKIPQGKDIQISKIEHKDFTMAISIVAPDNNSIILDIKKSDDGKTYNWGTQNTKLPSGTKIKYSIHNKATGKGKSYIAALADDAYFNINQEGSGGIDGAVKLAEGEDEVIVPMIIGGGGGDMPGKQKEITHTTDAFIEDYPDARLGSIIKLLVINKDIPYTEPSKARIVISSSKAVTPVGSFLYFDADDYKYSEAGINYKDGGYTITAKGKEYHARTKADGRLINNYVFNDGFEDDKGNIDFNFTRVYAKIKGSFKFDGKRWTVEDGNYSVEDAYVESRFEGIKDLKKMETKKLRIDKHGNLFLQFTGGKIINKHEGNEPVTLPDTKTRGIVESQPDFLESKYTLIDATAEEAVLEFLIKGSEGALILAHGNGAEVTFKGKVDVGDRQYEGHEEEGLTLRMVKTADGSGFEHIGGSGKVVFDDSRGTKITFVGEERIINEEGEEIDFSIRLPSLKKKTPEKEVSKDKRFFVSKSYSTSRTNLSLNPFKTSYSMLHSFVSNIWDDVVNTPHFTYSLYSINEESGDRSLVYQGESHEDFKTVEIGEAKKEGFAFNILSFDKDKNGVRTSIENQRAYITGMDEDNNQVLSTIVFDTKSRKRDAFGWVGT
ncbi:MAG: hypothetical protein H8D54_02525, partial [Candidatus Omnitrophica bacterium]|nr:hypothetical protein [Candidatus Omnitrophota bacterium]